MVFCGICKENRETRNRWIVHEHAVDNSLLRDFRICDTCASFVIKKVLEEMKTNSTEATDTDLIRSGLIGKIALAEDSGLEITLKMDLAKARKTILDHTDLKAEQKADLEAEQKA